MKRTVIGFALVGILLISIVPRLSPHVFAQTASAQAPHIGEGGLPQFEKDSAWPKVPPKWKMGFGSAVAIDEQNHVWILSRPRTLVNPRSTEPDLKSAAAPPVMEFDNEATSSRAGVAKAGRDINGRRTNTASQWIPKASCGSWETRMARETIPPIFRTTTRFSSLRKPANS